VTSLGRWAGSPSRVGAEVPLGHDAPADRVVTSPGPSPPCDGSGRFCDSRLAVGKHVEVVIVPFAGRAGSRCALEDQSDEPKSNDFALRLIGNAHPTWGNVVSNCRGGRANIPAWGGNPKFKVGRGAPISPRVSWRCDGKYSGRSGLLERCCTSGQGLSRTSFGRPSQALQSHCS